MRDYSLHPKIHVRKGKRNYLIYLLAVFIVIGGIFGGNKLLSKTSKQQESIVLSNNQNRDTQISALPKDINSSKDLLEKLEKKIEGKAGSFSLYIVDLTTDISFGINEDTVITAASVNKIPIIASLYHLAKNGDIDLEKTYTIQAGDIQNYGTGIIRYENPGKTYSIKTLARLMTEKSDNTAAYVLGTHVVGIDKIQNLINSWGLTQTDIATNKTSVKDMARLMIKIYKGEITNSSLSSEMLGFMDNSDFEERIPTGVPDNITVYHKTGDEVGKIHDVAIVNYPIRPYFLGILTFDVYNIEEVKRAMADISRMVYEYMSKL